MKNHRKIILWCGIMSVMLGMVSCTDYLDKEPESILNETVAFKNFVNFQGYTEELYNLIPDLPKSSGVSDYNWGEDMVLSLSNQNKPSSLIDRGDYRALLGNSDCFLDRNYDVDPMNPTWMSWPPKNASQGANAARSVFLPSWYGIRKANIGLANLQLLTDATQEEKDLIEGQLLFFRAFFHFQLIQYWGPVPYINEVLPADQPLRLPRPAYHEVADLIAKDFRDAADLLPFHWDNTNPGRERAFGLNRYRCNKAMALAFMAKNYLYAGSPLMNKQSTGSESYEAEYCKKAATAAAELLKYVDSRQTHHRLMPWDSITDLFYTFGREWLIPGGDEAIFQAPNYFAQATNWSNSRVFAPQAPLGRELPVYVPSANYVNYYGMANGLPLDHPLSGYDPEYPWRNRDPRFYKDIICDGRKCVEGPLGATTEQFRYASLYTGGSYRDQLTGSRTGYLCYKWIPITANKYDVVWDQAGALTFHGTYIRLADVYLMYAEAAAMGYESSMGKDPGYNLTATGAVNAIRNRSNVDLLPSDLDINTFMSELRRERAVELSFEGHRFNDLRRWLLLTKYPYNIKTAHEFDRGPDVMDNVNVGNNRVLNLREVEIVERQLVDKHYWIPFRIEQVSMYEAFPQNPGW